MKAFCISHAKDVDGLSAAALVRAATGAELLLTDYNSLIRDLDRVPEDAERVVICDMGTDVSSAQEFADKLGRIASRAEVTYIDHHYISEASKRRIRRRGVKVVQNVKECASILTYLTFKDSLPERARLIALCGAVTDYMDDSPAAKKLMEQADRHFVLLEATMLAYAVAKRGDEPGYPEMVANELSQMKHPHEIQGVPELAVEQLRDVVRLGEEVQRLGRKMGRLAYMVTSQHSTGGVAKLLIGGFEVPLGVAMREKETGWYEVSLRCTSECRMHLGRTISQVAGRLGGNGGGHRKAAGCRIPVARAPEMLALLAKKV
ncbi:MAG: DHHA1 domain-containing protein [Nitrososphaerales archaeon]|nr:DHHA1 domain-containing protein [Nitrososphaerales archaeon]